MPPEAREPAFIIVMGVSGTGKSTIAAKLAVSLTWEYEDADSFHPRANVEKMHRGEPLTDADRWPWLKAIAAWMEEARWKAQHAVIACSALKRAYRQILVGHHSDVRLVYLKGTRQLIGSRLALRHDHFMPPGLLDSQFAALEEPGAEERPIIVSIEGTPQEIVDNILSGLGMGTHRGTSGRTALGSRGA